MESNQGNPSDPTSNQSPTTSQFLSDPRQLRPQDVLNTIRSDSDTASLYQTAIAKNPSSTQVIDPQKLAADEAQARANEQKTAPPAEAPASNEARPTFFDEVPADEPKAETAPAEEVPEPDEFDNDEPNSIASNFKKLRGSFRETKQALKAKDAALREAETKLATYVPPEVLQERELEIERLAGYEKILNLKGTKEYQDKFIAPLTEKSNALKEMFKDYGVPEQELDNIVERAVTINNNADLDRFLSNHFDTELGAVDAKNIIKSIKGIRNEAQAAEKEPTRVLESLQEQSKALRERQEVERRARVKKTATDTWVETLGSIRAEGEITELIPREGDTEFNENYPNRIVKQAATEFGKLVTELTKEGAELSKGTQAALAKMVLLSQTAGVAIVTRDRALTQAEQLAANTKRTTGLYRPSMGAAPRGGSAGSGPKKETSLKEDIQGLVSSVLQKR